jgi:membrane protease YdiL (CAAX protease family)
VPGWVPFTGLTAVVLALLLGLARLSQRAVSDQPALPAEPDTTATAEDADEGSTVDAPPEPDTEPAAATPGATDVPATDSGPMTVTGRIDTEDGTAQSGEPPAPQASAPRRDLSTGALLANVALTQGLFGAVVAIGAWYYEIPATALGLTDTAVGTGAFAVAVGILFGVLLWTANELSATVADAVGAAYDDSLREMLAPDSVSGWLLLLGVILPIIAIVEELLFRAALIGVPAAGFGIHPLALAIVSSVLFALGHGAQGRVGIAVTGGLGFVLAGGYILSGSLLVVVIAHYLVNALEFLVHEGVGAERLLP